MLALTGDATQERRCWQPASSAGDPRMRALPSDADNVFITLTLRNLNPTLQIIARAEYASSEKKLLQAGATRVVLPLVAGCRQRIARMIARPNTAEVIDHVVNRDMPDVDLDELLIPPSSSLVGLPLKDSTANQLHRLLIIAISRSSGEKIFNPRGDFSFKGSIR